MPNINIDDAYILNETGAQVDKVTGLYFKDESTSAAEKAFAQLNIGTAGSNPNLLDNPWFTVNQRGVNGTITNGQYGLDRWMAGGGTVTMATGGITLGAGNSYAMQRPADPSIFNGKTVTLSVMTSDGVVESGTVVAQTGSAKTVRTANFELCIGYTAYNAFYFYNISSTTKTVIAAKLELGSVSTLANDAPPEYGEELAKCQRYFLRISQSASNAPMGFGVATSPTSALVTIPIPVTMRSGGTITVTATGATTLRFGSSNVTVTSIAFRNIAPNAIAITANVASGLSGNNAVMFMPDAGYILNISADL